MERNRVCKICSRRFSNGKAMGGHMRSHFAKLPPRLPPATLTPSSSLSLSTHQQQQRQQHREKPRTSVPPAAQDRAATVHDRGSDTEPSRRRGKRNRSRRRRRRRGDGSAGRADAFSNADVEQTISSVSETSEALSEADVALCLIMLSRDKWPKRARTEADEHEDDGDDSVSVTQTDSRAGSSRPKYQCETCNRGFGSYQALGGHRASHKKMSDESHNHKRRLAFECPYCHKVFDSGQALGGHKKVHNEAITVAAKKSKNCGESSIDLNLPAPEENGEGETTASLVEISSVSNEETLYPIKKAFLQL